LIIKIIIGWLRLHYLLLNLIRRFKFLSFMCALHALVVLRIFQTVHELLRSEKFWFFLVWSCSLCFILAIWRFLPITVPTISKLVEHFVFLFQIFKLFAKLHSFFWICFIIIFFEPLNCIHPRNCNRSKFSW